MEENRNEMINELEAAAAEENGLNPEVYPARSNKGLIMIAAGAVAAVGAAVLYVKRKKKKTKEQEAENLQEVPEEEKADDSVVIEYVPAEEEKTE